MCVCSVCVHAGAAMAACCSVNSSRRGGVGVGCGGRGKREQSVIDHQLAEPRTYSVVSINNYSKPSSAAAQQQLICFIAIDCPPPAACAQGMPRGALPCLWPDGTGTAHAAAGRRARA